MSRPLLVVPVHLVALGAALLQASCTAGDTADLQPPPGYAPAFHPLRPPIPRGTLVRYGEGFYGPESNAAGATWRWMAKHGIVYLPNDHHDQQLHLAGWVPFRLLKQAPTITVAVNEVELDRFVATDGPFIRDYSVASAPLGTAAAAQLTIETSATAFAPGDLRELGVNITALGWRDAPTAAQPTPLAGATSAH